MSTLKVRIAVVVAPNNLEWNSSGWGGYPGEPSDNEKMESALDGVEGEQRFWVDAELEVAPVQVVNGVVSAG